MSSQTNPLSISEAEPLTILAPETALADRLREKGITLDHLDDYLAGNAHCDQNLLVAQALLFSDYIYNYAFQLLSGTVTNVLHVGCGTGQLTPAFRAMYPTATIVGVDSDPAAIEAAIKAQERAGLIINPIDFAVCDLDRGLPEGPFDLVYVSMLLHEAVNPQKMLQLIKKAVKPGGYLWLKEPLPEFRVKNPSFMEFTDLLAQSVFRTGRDPFVGQELPSLMADMGFYNITLGKEIYPLNKDSYAGRVSIGALLAEYRASIPMIVKMLRIPEDEIMRLYEDICRNVNHLRGISPYANVVARRAGNFVAQ